MFDIWVVFILAFIGMFISLLAFGVNSVTLRWWGIAIACVVVIYVLAVILYDIWTARVRRLSKKSK